jgi:acetyltransferase-like isoleucine patch superfamily enzyme
MFTPHEFFDLTGYDETGLFIPDQPVWRALDRLPHHLESAFDGSWPLSGVSGQIETTLVIHQGQVRDDLEVKAVGPKGHLRAFINGEVVAAATIVMAGSHLLDDRIILGPGTVVEPGAVIRGPSVFGRDTEIRQGAYVRGTCLVGDGCVVGHATEMKSSIMLDGSKAGHFAYIGDSILGRDANLGAGTKLANLKLIPGSVVVRVGRERHDTGRRKLGAILGDRTATGCNSVTSPGVLMGPDSIVYPCVSVAGGYYPARAVITPPRALPEGGRKR